MSSMTMNGQPGLLSWFIQHQLNQVGVSTAPFQAIAAAPTGSQLVYVLAIAILSFLIGTWIVRELWNAVATRLFNVPEITFLQAAGIKLLISGLLSGTNLF